MNIQPLPSMFSPGRSMMPVVNIPRSVTLNFNQCDSFVHGTVLGDSDILLSHWSSMFASGASQNSDVSIASGGGRIPSPIGGGGATGDDGGDGVRSFCARRVIRLLKAMERDISTFPTAKAFRTRMRIDLSKLTEAPAKLDYIKGVGKLIRNGEPAHFDETGIIECVHQLAISLDDATDYIAVDGMRREVDRDVYNIINELFDLIVNVEKTLVEEEEYSAELRKAVADIHAIYARKGLFFYVLKDDDGGNTIPSFIMYALDAIERYRALGEHSSVEREERFLDMVRTRYGLPRDMRTWAFVEKQKLVMPMSGLPKSIQKNALDGAYRGLYLFSPAVYHIYADRLTILGNMPLAAYYREQAREHFKIAAALALLTVR